jgi:hypothetical protein
MPGLRASVRALAARLGRVVNARAGATDEPRKPAWNRHFLTRGARARAAGTVPLVRSRAGHALWHGS